MRLFFLLCRLEVVGVLPLGQRPEAAQLRALRYILQSLSIACLSHGQTYGRARLSFVLFVSWTNLRTSVGAQYSAVQSLLAAERW